LVEGLEEIGEIEVIYFWMAMRSVTLEWRQPALSTSAILGIQN
jgi:hypothetical protein